MTDRPGKRTPSSASGGGAVYALGLIGALVWFWQQHVYCRAGEIRTRDLLTPSQAR
jgi:hypothetical protein